MAFRPRSVVTATRAQTLTHPSLESRVRNVQAFAARRRNVLMSHLKLTLACWDYDRTRPLIDGRVKPEGIDLDIEILRPRQAFQRMLDKKEFNVSELSLASHTQRSKAAANARSWPCRSHSPKSFGIPAFTCAMAQGSARHRI